MKGVKNEVELAHTREAHLRDGVAMVRFQIELENRLAAGEELTELTIDEILHKYRSAQDKFLTESFGTIAAYGPNAAMMHYHATEEDHAKLEKKGFLLVDSGATYMDGTTDITRTYPLGELTEDERLFYTWTLPVSYTHLVMANRPGTKLFLPARLVWQTCARNLTVLPAYFWGCLLYTSRCV